MTQDQSFPPCRNPYIGGWPESEGSTEGYYAGFTPPESPRGPKRRSWVARHKVLTGLAVIAALTGVAAVARPADPVAVPGPGHSAIAAASTTVADPVEATTAAVYEPRNSDFTLAVKITEKQCFGDAGCNVTARVDLSKVAARVPDDATVDVTYELRGVQDGPSVGTISVQGGRYDPNDEYVQTSSTGKKLTAVVTSVESR